MVKYTIEDNTIRIPSAVKQISGLDLKDKGNNITLVVGANVERIADLQEFGYVKEYKVDKSNMNFASKSGVLYNASLTTIYRYPVYKTSKKFYGSKELTKINTYAFREATFEKCEFYDGLTTVLEGAFKDCKKLKSIELPGTAVSVGNNIFAGCKKLKQISFPDMATLIPYGTFDGCKKLKHIIMPEGTKKIMARAFANCDSLKTLYLPKSITEVKDYATYKSNIKFKLDARNPYIKLKDGKVVNKQIK